MCLLTFYILYLLIFCTIFIIGLWILEGNNGIVTRLKNIQILKNSDYSYCMYKHQLTQIGCTVDIQACYNATMQ